MRHSRFQQIAHSLHFIETGSQQGHKNKEEEITLSSSYISSTHLFSYFCKLLQASNICIISWVNRRRTDREEEKKDNFTILHELRTRYKIKIHIGVFWFFWWKYFWDDLDRYQRLLLCFLLRFCFSKVSFPSWRCWFLWSGTLCKETDNN